MYRYFIKIGNTDYISLCKSKGLSYETIKLEVHLKIGLLQNW